MQSLFDSNDLKIKLVSKSETFSLNVGLSSIFAANTKSLQTQLILHSETTSDLVRV
jgi:hypothetical protein